MFFLAGKSWTGYIWWKRLPWSCAGDSWIILRLQTFIWCFTNFVRMKCQNKVRFITHKRKKKYVFWNVLKMPKTQKIPKKRQTRPKCPVPKQPAQQYWKRSPVMILLLIMMTKSSNKLFNWCCENPYYANYFNSLF